MNDAPLTRVLTLVRPSFQRLPVLTPPAITRVPAKVRAGRVPEGRLVHAVVEHEPIVLVWQEPPDGTQIRHRLDAVHHRTKGRVPLLGLGEKWKEGMQSQSRRAIGARERRTHVSDGRFRPVHPSLGFPVAPVVVDFLEHLRHRPLVSERRPLQRNRHGRLSLPSTRPTLILSPQFRRRRVYREKRFGWIYDRARERVGRVQERLWFGVSRLCGYEQEDEEARMSRRLERS